MPTTIFRPTSPTNQNQPKMKISNLSVFCPIWIRFGIWANNGPRITWYNFEMASATFYASAETPHIPSRTIILFRFFFCFSAPFRVFLLFFFRLSAPFCAILVFFRFLDASSHLYNWGCPSVRPSVGRSVGPSVGPSVGLSVGPLVKLSSKTGNR